MPVSVLIVAPGVDIQAGDDPVELTECDAVTAAARDLRGPLDPAEHVLHELRHLEVCVDLRPVHLVNARLPPQARRIHEDEPPAMVRHRRVDRVTGGSGDFRYDQTLLAHGEPFGVRRLGELLLRCLRRQDFSGHLEKWLAAQPRTPIAGVTRRGCTPARGSSGSCPTVPSR